MQLIDSPDRPSAALRDDDLALVWPGSSADDTVRRTLASVLLDDPDHRLRVAHIESLLQLRLPAHTGYTSGLGLQTLLLRDNATAAVFHVDFDNTRVADWRSRVVRLDVSQLAKEVAAAKQHGQQQQQHDEDTPHANGSSAHTPNGISSVPIPERSYLGAATGIGGSSSDQQQQRISPLSSSLGRQQPYNLCHIWGASPVFGAGGSLGHSSGAVEPPSSRASAPGARSSSIMSTPAVAGSAGTGDQSRVSLFGGSFEVPHAIASCWAAPSSCGSGVGSVGRRTSQGGDASAAPPAGGLATVLHQAAKTQGGGILDQVEQGGGGGSSTTSGSSSRSISAAAHAAAVAASRLRKTSDTALGLDVVEGGKGTGKVEGASVAGSAGGLSGCLDVSTPKSCGGGDASASPVTSGSGEDETEYNEAQLLFGVSGAGTASGPAAAGAEAATEGANGSAAAISSSSTRSTATAAPAGDSGASPISCGVDWSRIAALHGQQQLAAGYHSPLHSRSMPGAQQQKLLFGVDDVSSSAAAAAVTAQLMQQQLAMLGAQFHTSRSTGDQSNGLLSNTNTALGGSLFATAATGLSVGPTPTAVHGMLLQQQNLNGNPNYLGAAATAAQLAESVLHDLDASGFGAQSSYPVAQQQQQMHYAGSATLHSSSYGSAVHSDRSSSGQWGASPVANAHAGYGALQQQQPRQQQPQQHRASDNSGDVATRADQLRPDSNASTRPAAATAPGKQAETFAAVAAARDKPPATAAGSGNAGVAAGPGNAGAAPRLTGWASVAARDPKVMLQSPSGTPNAAAAASNGIRDFGNAVANGMRQQQGGSKLGGGPLSRLPPAVRSEVQALIAQFTGVLKVDDFDDGVVHQLNAKRSEEEAIAAVRHIAHYDLANIQHMAAYLNHLVKHYNYSAAAAAAAAEGTGSAGFTGAAAGGVQAGLGTSAPGPNGAAATQLLLNQSGSTLGSTLSGPGNRTSGGGVVVSASGAAAAGGNLGAYGGQIRLASVPVSTKAMLQKLPLKVFKQLEQLVGSCAYLEWRHFDAGVVKVLAQLSKLCEGDVFEELELLAATDLSNVEYMPAYLNKRLNNKLWSRRKADGHINNNN